jgi:preprotein translocase subunit YajC
MNVQIAYLILYRIIPLVVLSTLFYVLFFKNKQKKVPSHV